MSAPSISELEQRQAENVAGIKAIGSKVAKEGMQTELNLSEVASSIDHSGPCTSPG